jgi:hypothetical protein
MQIIAAACPRPSCAGTEPSFHLIGFLAAVFATAARAFKSILQVRTDDSQQVQELQAARTLAVCLREYITAMLVFKALKS